MGDPVEDTGLTSRTYELCREFDIGLTEVLTSLTDNDNTTQIHARLSAMKSKLNAFLNTSQPQERLPLLHRVRVTTWLENTKKRPGEARWGNYPIEMVQRLLEQAGDNALSNQNQLEELARDRRSHMHRHE